MYIQKSFYKSNVIIVVCNFYVYHLSSLFTSVFTN